MFKKLWRKLFGDPFAFRRVDYPDIPEDKLPRRLTDVDRVSRARRNRLYK